MEDLKKYFRTFSFSIVAITLLVLTVFLFMYLFGDYVMIKENQVKKIYFADNISPSHQRVIDKFNQLHKNKIEVIPIDLPFEKFSTNERKELLIRYLRGKSDRIDLFSVDQIWVPRFAKWAEPLSNYFSMPEREQLIPQALESCYYKDQLVAIPLYFDIGIMYYRSDILKTFPDYQKIKNEIDSSITWEKFFELGKRFKNKSANPFYCFPASNYEGLICSFVELLESQNQQLFVSDTIKLNTPEVEKALQMLVDIVNKDHLAPKKIVDFKETEAYLYFLNNNGLFLRGWPGFLRWYETNISNMNIANRFEAAPLPHFAGGKTASVIGGWNLMISKYSSNISEVLEFIRFLISEDAQKTFYRYAGYLPVIKAIYDEQPFLNANPELKFYHRLFRTAVRRPFLEKYTRYSDVLANYLNLAIRKELSVKDALAKAQKIINSNDIFIK